MPREEIPLKYVTNIELTKIKYIEVKCTSASGSSIKEEVPKYTGAEPAEVFMLVVETIQTLATRYNWWDTSVTAHGPELAFETMDRFLSGGALEA